MSANVTPSQLLATIPSGSGSLCDRFADFFSFPALFLEIYQYERNEQGDITPDFCQDIMLCAGLATVGGGGGGGGGGGSLAAPVISASDGAFSDKVQVTWGAIPNATQYLVYRAQADNVAQAVLIATVLDNSYDDTSAVVDTTYWYWVKASNGVITSAISNSDSGYFSTALAAVTDLVATNGVSPDIALAPTVYLHWTPVSGATSWDIYRSTTNDFSTADLLAGNRVPFDNSNTSNLGPAPYLVDNATDLLYIDTVAGADKHKTFYYWVVAKKNNPNALSAESNVGAGWAVGDGSGNTPDGSLHITDTADHLVIGSAVRAWIFFYGVGAGGAGGGPTFGGGGGGAPAALWGQVTVEAGGKFFISRTSGSAPANAAAQNNGANGGNWVLYYQGPSDISGNVVCQSFGAGGGLYNVTGSGAGGAGSVADNTLLTGGGSHDGWPGLPASGPKGGRSGHVLGGYRNPPAHFDGIAGFNGDGTGGGSGSVAINPSVSSATGGKPLGPACSIAFYNT